MWSSWYHVIFDGVDRLPVVDRIPAGPQPKPQPGDRTSMSNGAWSKKKPVSLPFPWQSFPFPFNPINFHRHCFLVIFMTWRSTVSCLLGTIPSKHLLHTCIPLKICFKHNNFFSLHALFGTRPSRISPRNISKTKLRSHPS